MSNETQIFAFFDVDGTVIAKDSFRILMSEMLLGKFWWRSIPAVLFLIILSVLRPFGLVGKTQYKSALLWSATFGLRRKKSLQRLKKIVDEKIAPLWFKEMEEELAQLRSSGHQICYVSASGEPWLRFLLNKKDSGKKLIVGSKLTSFCGGLTLQGENCLGPEKIRRLRKILAENVVWAVAYSDHRADLPLLLASRRRVVVNPTERNRRAFTKYLGASGFIEASWTPSAPPTH